MQILSLKQNYFSLLCTHNKLNRTDMICLLYTSVPFFTHHYSPTNIQNKKSFSKSIRSNKRTYPTVCLPFSFIQTRLELIKVKIMSKIAVYHPSSILSPEKIGKYKKEPYICLNIKYQ